MKTWMFLAAAWLAVPWQLSAEDRFLVTPGRVNVTTHNGVVVGGTLTLKKNANGGPLRRGGGCLVYQVPGVACTKNDECSVPGSGGSPVQFGYCKLQGGGQANQCWRKFSADDTGCLKQEFTLGIQESIPATPLPASAGNTPQVRILTCTNLLPDDVDPSDGVEKPRCAWGGAKEGIDARHTWGNTRPLLWKTPKGPG